MCYKLFALLFVFTNLFASEEDHKQTTIQEQAIEKALDFLKQEDFQSAIDTLLVEAEKGDVESQFLLGMTYSYTKDFNRAAEWGEKSAIAGHPTGQALFAGLLAEGSGVDKDLKNAKYWFEKSAEQGDRLGYSGLGLMYYKGEGVQQDYQQALSWLNQAANLNCAYSLHTIGQMYLFGQGVAKDYAKAKEYFEKGAQLGCAASQLDLGIMYYKGEGMKVDYEQAAYWYQKSAEQDNSTAQMLLGSLYKDGKGVSKDNDEARTWLLKALDNGNSNAGIILAETFAEPLERKPPYKSIFMALEPQQKQKTAREQAIKEATDLMMQRNFQSALDILLAYAEKGDVESQLLMGIIYLELKNIEKAGEWLEKAAIAGHPKGQALFACFLTRSLDKQSDPESSIKQAIYWLEKSAEQGEARGYFGLGQMYFHGYGVKQDYQQAFTWYDKAAIKNCAFSLQQVGRMYLSGQGVSKDQAKGEEYLRNAKEVFEYWAKLGDAQYQLNLGIMYHEGEGTKMDYEQAAYWIHKAAKQSNAFAQYAIGCLYKEGNGIKKDLNNAIYWLKTAIKNGNSEAKNELQEIYNENKHLENSSFGDSLDHSLEAHLDQPPTTPQEQALEKADRLTK